MPLEQHAWILDSSAVMASCFISTGRAMSILAKRTATWDEEFDHMRFSYNGNVIVISKGHLSPWKSPKSYLTVERTSDKNSVLMTLPDIAEILVNLVMVTREDDRIPNYQIPSDDCFAHLELQFKFYRLSSKIERVLGRTYQPNFMNHAKPGTAMPIVGGEDKYRTSSLLAADRYTCKCSPARASD
ncbi:hypothetical protein Gotur_002081 [Gossypium turneri]